MFKLCIIFAVVAIAAAAPAPGILGNFAVAAPLAAAVPAPFVTAASSQVIARNYNTLAAAPLAAYTAPLAYASPYAAAPLAYSTHAVAPAYAAAYAAAPALYY